MLNFIVLSGAGISAESGLKTFRDANGLWEGHDVMQVASPQGFKDNPELVLEFYNQRRRQLKKVLPNKAHQMLAELEDTYKVSIITQNVDNLHERAGSSNVLHLHGELIKAESTGNPNFVTPWHNDLNMGDTCDQGFQLRPHIVWFGEDVPKIKNAIEICETADILLIIGTSLQVYPAASLVQYVPHGIPIYLIDPKPSIKSKDNIRVIPQTATKGMQTLFTEIGFK